MDHAQIVRKLRFRARHHYWRPEWSESRNRSVFGDQTRPHEHEWAVEIHVVGTVDPETGWCVDLGVLDAALAAATKGWEGGDLNALVPEVASGELVPSTEVLARWLYQAMSQAPLGSARVVRVGVSESPSLGSFFPPADG